MGKMELMTSMDSFPSKTYTESHVQRMTICPAAANNSLTPREVNKKNAAILKVIARNEKNKINIKTRKFASKYRLKFAQPLLIKINDKLQRKARKKLSAEEHCQCYNVHKVVSKTMVRLTEPQLFMGIISY
jgi:hypothetical protein